MEGVERDHLSICLGVCLRPGILAGFFISLPLSRSNEGQGQPAQHICFVKFDFLVTVFSEIFFASWREMEADMRKSSRLL